MGANCVRLDTKEATSIARRIREVETWVTSPHHLPRHPSTACSRPRGLRASSRARRGTPAPDRPLGLLCSTFWSRGRPEQEIRGTQSRKSTEVRGRQNQCHDYKDHSSRSVVINAPAGSSYSRGGTRSPEVHPNLTMKAESGATRFSSGSFSSSSSWPWLPQSGTWRTTWPPSLLSSGDKRF